MYTVNQQIKDTFRAFSSNNGFATIPNLAFSKFLWINGSSANAALVSVSEDSVTGGVYYLNYTPTVTGTHYINLFSSTAIFDANYYVLSGVAEVAQSVWGYSISGSAVTAGSMGQALSSSWQIQTGKWEMVSNQLKLYDKDGITILQTFNLFDLANAPSLTGVVKRVPA